MTAQSNLTPSLPLAAVVEKRERKLPVRVPLTEASTAQLMRPLGAYERAFHRIMEEYPMHFSVVVELAGAFEPAQLRQALVAVQHRHPLLSGHIEDHPGTRLGYYRPAVVPPIPLSVLDADLHWEQLVAQELATAFDATAAPLMRAVLLRQGPAAATLILTFDHVIADGKSAVYIVQDILAVLHGQPLAVLPVPPSRETLLARRPAPAAPATAPAAAVSPDPDWLTAKGTLLPFDGTLPTVTSLAFSEALTSQLAQRCRAEQTTVHAALVVAASQVLARAGHRQHVRVTSPIDIREVLGAGRDSAMYFDSTRTAYTAAKNEVFWELARATGAQLTQGRAESTTRFISAMMEQLIPLEADHEIAKNLSLAGSRELFVSNLGRLQFSEAESIRPVAIWGPIILTQMQGESTIGVATLHGQLRLVSASHAPIPDFLALVQDQLAKNLAEPATGTQSAADTGYLRGLMAQETIY